MEESLVVFLVRELNNQHNQDGGDDDDDGDFVEREGVCSFPGSRARRLATDRKIPLNFFLLDIVGACLEDICNSLQK